MINICARKVEYPLNLQTFLNDSKFWKNDLAIKHVLHYRA
jgi:hypothetical protein